MHGMQIQDVIEYKGRNPEVLLQKSGKMKMNNDASNYVVRSYKSKTKVNIGNIDLFMRRKLARMET
jgi:hypothetical protein